MTLKARQTGTHFHGLNRKSGIAFRLFLVMAQTVFAAMAGSRANAPLHPLAIWASDPFEVRIAFDQILDASMVRNLKDVTIEFSEPDSGLDLSPPKIAIPPANDPSNSTVGRLHVAAIKLAANRRTLILNTDPHPLAANYLLHLAGFRPPGKKSDLVEFHLAYNLLGVEASWSSGKPGAMATWSGWLPDLDTTISLGKLAGSSEHEPLAKLLRRPGRLTIKALLEPRPLIGEMRLVSTAPFQLTLDGHSIKPTTTTSGALCAQLKIQPGNAYPVLTVCLTTGVGEKSGGLRVEFPDSSHTPRMLLPWAPPPHPAPGKPPVAPTLAGGNIQGGRELFTGNQLKCASCHRIRGEGGQVGPDLSQQYLRTPAAILNDIVNPNDHLNPNYVSFNLALREGVDVSGFVHLRKDNTVQLVESDGKTNVVKRAEIQAIRASAVSMMPTGLLDTLRQDQIRDLLTFLAQPPE